MKRIVIIGGSGFIGQHLVAGLNKQGFETVVYDLNEPAAAKPSFFVQGNVSDTERIKKTIWPNDLVVHMSHSGIPEGSNQDPAADVEANLPVFIRLLKTLAEARISRIIYSSTGGQIYGHQGYMAVSENAALNPISSYGIVKLAMEHYLRLSGRTQGLRFNIVRIANPYGPLQELSNQHGAVAAIMRCLLDDKHFTMFGDGETVRDYIYIDDVVAAITSLIKSDTQEQTFNVATGRGTSLNQLIEAIEKVSKKKLKVARRSIRDSDVKLNLLDSSLLKEQTGWEPEVDLEEGLDLTWQAMRDDG